MLVLILIEFKLDVIILLSEVILEVENIEPLTFKIFVLSVSIVPIETLLLVFKIPSILAFFTFILIAFKLEVIILLSAVILEVENIEPLTFKIFVLSVEVVPIPTLLLVINKPSILTLPALYKVPELLILIEFKLDVITLLSAIILEVENIEPLTFKSFVLSVAIVPILTLLLVFKIPSILTFLAFILIAFKFEVIILLSAVIFKVENIEPLTFKIFVLSLVIKPILTLLEVVNKPLILTSPILLKDPELIIFIEFKFEVIFEADIIDPPINNILS